MNQEREPYQCKVCGESEPSFIHTVMKDSAFRRLCTNCLLEENRGLFCPICSEVYLQVPSKHKRCVNCSSMTHAKCILNPPSPSATFFCEPCKDPDFVFFPKSFVPTSDENGDDTLKVEWAKALTVAAKISAANLKSVAKQLRQEATAKIHTATAAKWKAKQALAILHDIVAAEKEKNKDGEEKKNPNKRKDSDR